MGKLRILVANALAGSLDASVGVLVVVAAHAYAGQEPALWQLALGAVLAILPDFDIVPTILRGREVSGNHRVSPMHRPLLLIPITGLVAWLLGGVLWLCIALICVMWHFLHDTPPLSLGGIAWLWPFDKRYWSWYGPKEPRDESDMTHYEWLKKYWFRPSALSVTEVGAAIAALITALFIAVRAF